MSGQLRDPSPGEADWIALADELAPAKSLVRLDAANARITSAIAVVGILLSGISVVTVESGGVGRGTEGLLVATVILGSLAVIAALAGQVLSITWRLNRNDLQAVQRWFERRVTRRAPLAAVAGWLLVASAATAATAAVIQAAAPGASPPTVSVARVSTPAPSADGSGVGATDAASISVDYSGLEPGDALSVEVRSDGDVVATAVTVVGAASSGAEVVEIAGLLPGSALEVDVVAGSWSCAVSVPGPTAERGGECVRGGSGEAPVG